MHCTSSGDEVRIVVKAMQEDTRKVPKAITQGHHLSIAFSNLSISTSFLEYKL
jgi:hypothetical protein